jgi:hypothetical protein
MVMAKRRDFQILWVVAIAAVCWGALWEHEAVSTWVLHAWRNRPRF